MSQQHILQVSQLTKKVRFLLESEINRVWLCGEISNFVAASSGHWYLSLKDSKSQVKCAMFKGNNRNVRLTPRNGQQVLVRAKVSLYEPRGDFQLIIEQLEDAGEGLLRQQFEQLKQKLAAEGLFAPNRKQAIPSFIQSVGLITSPTGAAIKDMLTVLQRRSPHLNIFIYPSMVQGQQATAQIVNAIAQANARKECDVLLVGRGGGSLEDLWCFNEESLVRAIANSQLPIISAVGHEIDTTLADFAADLRAATPSAAAELVSQEAEVLLNKISTLMARLAHAHGRNLVATKQRLLTLQHRLARVEPRQKLQYQQQKTDELTLRLKQAIKQRLQQLRHQPQQLTSQLLQRSPVNKIAMQKQKLVQMDQKLKTAIIHTQDKKQAQFKHLIEQLHIMSPLATIARGYSVARTDKGAIIRSTAQVKLADEINLQLQDGVIHAKIIANK